MQFGANLFGVGPLADPAALARVARLAEGLGFHSVFLADHVILPRHHASKYPYTGDGSFPYQPDLDWLDPLVALGYLAGRTRTIRIGTSITVLPMRQPIVTAKQIATVDRLSGGRIILGVGVGWLAEEFALLGVPFAERGRRMDEYLRLMRVLWTEQNPTFSGEYVRIADCAVTPKPVQARLPVWVGGESPAALRRAARLGDAWHSAGSSLDALPAQLERLDRELAAAGRERKDFTVSVFPTERLTLDLARRLAGHGVDHVMASVFSRDLRRIRQRLEQIATEVIEPFGRG